MNDISLTHLLDVAVRSAQAAGNHALSNIERRNEVTETFDHDVKLVLDVESQKAAESVILSEFPEHAILGEEDVTPNDASSYEWVIDPIDGTMNFSHGFQYWCSSVAVRKNGTVLAGCVYAPEFDALYTAHLEDSARLNGSPVHISQTPELSNAMIFTGISKHMHHADEEHFKVFIDLELNSKKIRINGAAALDLCRLADGTADGFYEGGIYLWDYAAAGLIAERAGADMVIHPTKGGHQDVTVLAANKTLLQDLETIYANHNSGTTI